MYYENFSGICGSNNKYELVNNGNQHNTINYDNGKLKFFTVNNMLVVSEYFEQQCWK